MQTKPSKGFGAVAEEPKKPRRYSQPMGTQCGVYLPPLLIGGTWAEVAKNPAHDLVITEGELKAACGCKFGFSTIGLGGVYNWRSAKETQELLPILEKFVWLGRKVVICFDSDTKDNPMVRMAASRLAYTLSMRGAVVTWAQLPETDEGTKQGMDDYIFANGEEAFARLLLDNNEDLGPGRELHRLNSEVAVVHDTGEIVELTTGNVYSMSVFSDTVYRNRTYMETDDNKRMVRKYAAKEWLSFDHRTRVTQLAYEPGCNNMITPSGAYNTWYPQRWPIEPRKASVAPWEALLQYVLEQCSDEHKKWLRQWFAYPIQHPGTKLHTAVLVWGGQGGGKTMLGQSMKYIYGRNFSKVGNSMLGSQFNGWAQNRQFVLGEEISMGDKRGLADNLKDMITGSTININVKNRKTYDIDDCINYYFSSNHQDAIYLEPDDRRMFVVHVEKYQKWTYEQFEAYDNWLAKEGGAQALFHYLKHEVDLTGFQPKGHAPITDAKREMVAAGRGDTEDWAATLKERPEAILGARTQDLYTVEELLKIYDVDSPGRTKSVGLGRALNSAKIFRVASGSNNIVIGGTRKRLYAVRNIDKYQRLSPSAAQKMYEAERDHKKFEAGKRVETKERVQ